MGEGLMLYLLLDPLRDQVPGLGVIVYILFRTAMASLTALAIGLLLGPWLIRRLRAFQIGQVVRSDGPATHKPKAGTPTMGGLLILAAVLSATLLWADLGNSNIWIAVLSMAAFGAIGFVDDYMKVTRHSARGLIARYKLVAQVGVALIIGFTLLMLARQTPPYYNTSLSVPFFKNLTPDFGGWYVLFAVIVLVFTSNAVNLTDGLDGLAISTFSISAVAYTALAYVTGHAVVAKYLLLQHLPQTGELTVFGGALIGASLGFLWWNAHPAEIFMGDVGSLALGGALGTMAILTKQELLLPIVGGIFVIEGLSVVIQVLSFRLTGRRVFRMAPIHHHFELIGWAEPKVIARFQIVAVIFTVFALTTLKLR
jgi:phospho-N-acetylmuramoyl-pentapeptide-transferase